MKTIPSPMTRIQNDGKRIDCSSEARLLSLMIGNIGS
jgi:hypothetical protein